MCKTLSPLSSTKGERRCICSCLCELVPGSWAGDKEQDKATATLVVLPFPERLSLGILALLIKHHNLIHTEDGAGSGDLAS